MKGNGGETVKFPKIHTYTLRRKGSI